LLISYLNNNMQVLILAAGMGNRLKPITNKVPKVMVKVSGKELIIHQLEILSRLPKISEILIAVGYKKNLIKKLIGKSFNSINITYIENNDYETTNNIYSLYLSLPYIKEDLLLVEGDVLFKPSLLKIITSVKEDTIFVEKFKPYMDGGVLEIDEDTKIVKRLIPKRDQGKGFEHANYYKTVNIYYFTHKFITDYYQPSLKTYINSYGKRDYYELVIGSLIYLNVCKLYAHVITKPLTWFEIDDSIDMNYAENFFFKKNLDFIQNKFGGYWNYDFLDFCYLYNLYFPPTQFIKEITDQAFQLINTYPSGQEYIKFLMSTFFDFPINKDWLFIGNGASELIKILNDEVIDSITIPVPTFDEYLNLVNKQKITYHKLSSNNQFKINLKSLVNDARKSNYLLLINPNNPTGQLLTRQKLLLLLKNLKNLKGIMLDESFIDFSNEDSAIKLVNDFPNLIYIKSISKSYGVPGLRLGYLYSQNHNVINALNKHLPIWNINSFAEKFLEKFTKYKDSFKNSLQSIKDDRKYLESQLINLPNLKVYSSQANYIMCQIKNNKISTASLTSKLFINDNIFIKDLSKKLDSSFFRLAIRKIEDNQLLIKSLKKYL